MNYKLCELYKKYTILSKYEYFIQIASCLHAFPLLWNAANRLRENEISLRNSSGCPEHLRTQREHCCSTLQRKCPTLW